jgi:CheY-like chemotaxis protein
MQHDLSTWKVLIVDDEPDNRGILEFVLSSYNAEVRCAESAQECLELMEAECPTLLLADIQMPGMSGTELLAKIREREQWKHLPVIAITAYAMPGDRERILASGFDGYIAKPLNVMQLADELKTLITAKSDTITPEACEPQAQAQATKPDEAAKDAKAAKEAQESTDAPKPKEPESLKA